VSPAVISSRGPQRRAVVIGAGLSGLAAAAALRGAGCAVTVLEATGAPGGLVRTETVDGHRFDTGATVLTMPGLIEEALAPLGVPAARVRAALALRPVDPGYVMNYADGTSLRVPRDTGRLAAAADAAFGAGAGAGVPALLDWLRRVDQTEYGVFFDRNYDSLPGLLDARTRRAAADLVRLRTLGGLTAAIARFVDDERLQRTFTFQALYAGVPPARARAIYAIIPDMDIGHGLSAPAGGMGRIGEVLAGELTAAGTEIEYRTRAVRIETSGRAVVAVHTDDGRRLPADVVVATGERDQVAGLLGCPARRRLRYSPSAVVVHGLLPAGAADTWRSGHHTVDFGAAWTRTFAEITGRRGTPMTDGSFLITRPAVSDPDTFVRDGLESISVLAPTPNLVTAPLDWETLAPAYTAEVLGVLAGRGYPRIDGLHVRRVDHPGSWLRAGLPGGTPFSAAHTVRQTGPLRTRNRWPGVGNLFLAGSATVPGVGIPPVLVSGKLAAQRALALLGLPEPR